MSIQENTIGYTSNDIAFGTVVRACDISKSVTIRVLYSQELADQYITIPIRAWDAIKRCTDKTILESGVEA